MVVAIIGLLVTTMLTSLSVTSVQVALGQRQTLPEATLIIGLAIFLSAMFGGSWLAIRYGQGGARLENPRSDAPPTNGLADNTLWRLGAFYVNRDDPSWLVEHRFGFGYTLNFGNPNAVATFVAFLAAILLLAVWAIVRGALDAPRATASSCGRNGTLKRFRGSAALVLTAFFAIAGSFHHHELPEPAHDHAGFCAAAVDFALEACALCRVPQTSIHLSADAVASFAADVATHLAVGEKGALGSVVATLLRDPRAPPIV